MKEHEIEDVPLYSDSGLIKFCEVQTNRLPLYTSSHVHKSYFDFKFQLEIA